MNEEIEFKIKNLKTSPKKIICDLYFQQSGLTIYSFTIEEYPEGSWTSITEGTGGKYGIEYEIRKKIVAQVVRKTSQFRAPEEI